MANVFLVDLESVSTRYTGQWKTHVPNLLRKEKHNVKVISGPEDIPSSTTPGAFLNFGGTNIYKSRQVEEIGRLFCAGAVGANDHFIFTDAWHPGIVNLKYMSELLGVPVKIHALWHAGSYDPEDFLGRLIGNTPWVRHAEKSFYHAIDHNYFATEFHIEMFVKNLLEYENSDIVRHYAKHKIIRSGWPMEYMPETLRPYSRMDKRDLILFPHRIAPEKQVEIFRDLKTSLPQYEFVVCQDQELTKNEYHNLLGQAKIVFSANLQETLGISCYEGALCGAIPMVPDRLSYNEMYEEWCLYPSEWTSTWGNYLNNKHHLIETIIDHVENYEDKIPAIDKLAGKLSHNFFSADSLLANLK